MGSSAHGLVGPAAGEALSKLDVTRALIGEGAWRTKTRGPDLELDHIQSPPPSFVVVAGVGVSASVVRLTR
jgi:hypothetical protein